MDAAIGLWLDSIIRRHERSLVIVALAAVAAFSALYAWFRPFWMDEFLTYDTAMLGSPTAVWRSLDRLPLSVDPPVYHILLQTWFRIVPSAELTARLPSVFAYTLMCFLLYRFVRRYMDVYAGLLVIMLSLDCGAFRYAHEARPYALVLAAVSLTLVCWASLVDGQKFRTARLLGMWLGIAIFVGSHWFGGLALAPFALGELVRSWQAHKIDLAVWLVLITGGATALLYLPLLKAAVAYRASPWLGARPWDAFQALVFVLEPCVIPLAILMIAIVCMRPVPIAPRTPYALASMPTPVLACLVCLALISFPGFILAKLTTHVLLPRYVLFCTIGLVVLLTGIIGSINASANHRLVVLLVITFYVVLFRTYDAREQLKDAKGHAADLTNSATFSQYPSAPIVFTDDESTFLQVEAHGSPAVRRRSVWLTDSSVPEVTRQNVTYLSIQALRLWTHVQISDTAPFLDSYKQFYYVSYLYSPNGWLLQHMMEMGADISFVGTFDSEPVYLISQRRSTSGPLG